MSYSGKRVCAKDECTNFFVDDRWGAIRANSDGWFLQRNNDAWCPLHVPSWVAEWRARKKGVVP